MVGKLHGLPRPKQLIVRGTQTVLPERGPGIAANHLGIIIRAKETAGRRCVVTCRGKTSSQPVDTRTADGITTANVEQGLTRTIGIYY